MNATTTNDRSGAGERRVRAAGPVRRRHMTGLRAAPAPTQPGRATHRDNGSHTPPHGDAVLRCRPS